MIDWIHRHLSAVVSIAFPPAAAHRWSINNSHLFDLIRTLNTGLKKKDNKTIRSNKQFLGILPRAARPTAAADGAAAAAAAAAGAGAATAGYPRGRPGGWAFIAGGLIFAHPSPAGLEINIADRRWFPTDGAIIDWWPVGGENVAPAVSNRCNRWRCCHLTALHATLHSRLMVSPPLVVLLIVVD